MGGPTCTAIETDARREGTPSIGTGKESERWRWWSFRFQKKSVFFFTPSGTRGVTQILCFCRTCWTQIIITSFRCCAPVNAQQVNWDKMPRWGPLDLRFIRADASSFSTPLPRSLTMKSASPCFVCAKEEPGLLTSTHRQGGWGWGCCWGGQSFSAANQILCRQRQSWLPACLPAWLGAIFRRPAVPVAV